MATQRKYIALLNCYLSFICSSCFMFSEGLKITSIASLSFPLLATKIKKYQFLEYKILQVRSYKINGYIILQDLDKNLPDLIENVPYRKNLKRLTKILIKSGKILPRILLRSCKQ